MAQTIDKLRGQIESIKGTLGSSSTAYARNIDPSSKDIAADKNLTSLKSELDRLQSKQIRNKWYGPTTAQNEDIAETEGLFMKGIKTIQKPLNAIMGAAQYAVGQGTESSLGQNINEAMKTGVLAGDILKGMGAPRAIQIPLGFALDVALDPVTWATLGTSALVPRVATGLVKGGAKGAGIKGALRAAKVGAVSSFQQDARTGLGLIPFTKKVAKLAPKVEKAGEALSVASKLRNTAIKGATKFRGGLDDLSTKAIKGGEEYRKLIGRELYEDLGRGVFGKGTGSFNLASKLGQQVNKIPAYKIFGKVTPTGEKISEFFRYSIHDANKIVDLKDKVSTLAKKRGAILVRGEKGFEFKNIDEFLSPKASIGVKDEAGKIMNTAIRDADGALDYKKLNKIGLEEVGVADTYENAVKLLDAAGDDYNLKHLLKAYETHEYGKTGVKVYDNFISKLKNTTVGDITKGHLGPVEDLGKAARLASEEGEQLVKTVNSYNKIRDMKPLNKILTSYPTYLTIFKGAKVPMNVAAHVVANIGNFFMGAMMGLPVWKKGYIRAVRDGAKFMKGKTGAIGLKKMFFDDVNSFVEMIEYNPGRFRQLTGVDPSEITKRISAELRIKGVASTGSIYKDVQKFLMTSWDELDTGVSEASKLARKEAEEFAKKGGFKTATETTQDLAKKAPVTRAEGGTSWIEQDLELGGNVKIDGFKNLVKNRFEENPNVVNWLSNTLVNKMPRAYERIDQFWKLGTTEYLTKIGLTEKELMQISKTVPVKEADIISTHVQEGLKHYRFTPMKASEVSMEAFMNYSAMPDFVRIMRAVPLAGHPFISFPYAMAIKTAKTAVDNPAIFNKVSFMLNEMNTGRTPQEKEALKEKYNEYLNEPTVAKVFGMWNTNVKNFIPYYTLNMLNPSERKYDDSFQGQMLKLSDKFPFLKDPIGQVIKDYFIAPWVLSGSGQQAQGQFGQPLYPNYDEEGNPIKVGLGTRSVYAARAAAESVVPGAFGYLGLAGRFLPDKAIEYVPSYGMRNLSYATKGKSSIGVSTKEDEIRKTWRSLLGRTGLPAYTLDPTKSSK